MCAGYGATCECLVQAALVILQEGDRWYYLDRGVTPPSPGCQCRGSPGYAFYHTTLVASQVSSNHLLLILGLKYTLYPQQFSLHMSSIRILSRLNEKDVTFTSVVEDI